jgi:katanin p60 ATPase-containing subunit A1
MSLDEDVDFNKLVALSKGYSGADITNVCRDASLMPMRRKLTEGLDVMELAQRRDEMDIPLTQKDFIDALKNISPSVSNTHLKEYEDWMKEFGSN